MCMCVCVCVCANMCFEVFEQLDHRPLYKCLLGAVI
jgi:hypothetical protein